MAKIIGYLRNIPGGTGQNGVTVTWKKKVDDSTVATDSTASDGYSYDNDGEFSFAQDGSPGPTYLTATYGGQTKRRESRESGQAGTWFPAEHPYYDLAHGDGVILGIDNEMSVDAPGGMNVRVATGSILVRGHIYRCTSATTVAVTAADPSNPRIDRIVCRLTQIGQTAEGKIELAVIAGTPAGSPTAAALTQTSATWEISLAQIRVNAGVGSITGGNITDERQSCWHATGRRGSLNPAFVLEKNDGTDVFKVRTDTPAVAIQSSTDFTIYSDAGTTSKFSVAGATGNTTIEGTLTANGGTTIGNATSDLLNITGRIKSSGTSPTIAAGAAAGSSPTISITGTDRCGVITLTPGATGRTTGTLFTVTLNAAKPDGNWVVICTPQDADALLTAGTVRFYNNNSLTTWIADVPTTALASNHQHKWQYIVEEYEP